MLEATIRSIKLVSSDVVDLGGSVDDALWHVPAELASALGLLARCYLTQP